MSRFTRFLRVNAFVKDLTNIMSESWALEAYFPRLQIIAILFFAYRYNPFFTQEHKLQLKHPSISHNSRAGWFWKIDQIVFVIIECVIGKRKGASSFEFTSS